MKAILLVGGKGTRLRPLTLKTPKPVVPIFDRPFLAYQLEALAQISEIDEVILSLNYQPDRIEDSLKADESFPFKIRYVVEPAPLGTAGAVRYAKQYIDDSILVFNGDVLAQLDLADVLDKHRQQDARATIVLTQIDDPAAYGLVETDLEGNVKCFLEKPEPGHIASNTINAGIYVLESDTLDRIPENTNWSLERSFFPSLIKNKEKPLALYIFTKNKKLANDLLQNISFGGACVNDTMTQYANPNLPFGGVGHSGIGNYHGEYSFKTFSHYKSIFKKSMTIDFTRFVRFAPWKGKFDFIKKIV